MNGNSTCQFFLFIIPSAIGKTFQVEPILSTDKIETGDNDQLLFVFIN